jgi:hypothetical protein
VHKGAPRYTMQPTSTIAPAKCKPRKERKNARTKPTFSNPGFLDRVTKNIHIRMFPRLILSASSATWRLAYMPRRLLRKRIVGSSHGQVQLLEFEQTKQPAQFTKLPGCYVTAAAKKPQKSVHWHLEFGSGGEPGWASGEVAGAQHGIMYPTSRDMSDTTWLCALHLLLCKSHQHKKTFAQILQQLEYPCSIEFPHITQAWWPSAVMQGLGVRTQRSSALGGSVSRQAHDTAWESYVDLFAIQPQQMSLHGRSSVLGEM